MIGVAALLGLALSLQVPDQIPVRARVGDRQVKIEVPQHRVCVGIARDLEDLVAALSGRGCPRAHGETG